MLRLSEVNIRLEFVSDAEGGRFCINPEDGGCPLIEIGIADEPVWPTVCEYITHELFEMLLHMRGLRFEEAQSASDLGAFLFVFRHSDLTQIAAIVGEFWGAYAPAVAKAYKKAIKKLHK